MRNCRVAAWWNMPLFLLLALCSTAAFAIDVAPSVNTGFSCSAAGTPSSGLFNGSETCNISGSSAFSGIVCLVQNTLNEIFSRTYCAIQSKIIEPLGALMTLYVAITGAFFATGVIQGTGRELSIRLIKVALIYAFATNANYGIGIAYNFFMSVAQEGVTIVLSQFKPDDVTNWTADAAMRHFDEILAHHASVDETSKTISKCGQAIATIMVLMAIAVPPLFLAALHVVFNLALIIGRALIGYVIAITGLTFMMAISPIFVSLALFKTTYSYFEKWLHYTVSFCIQMIVIFAFIAIMESISFAKFAKGLLELVVPYKFTFQWGANRIPVDACSICEHIYVLDAETHTRIPKCISNEAIPLLKLIQDQDIMFLLAVKIIAIILITYAMEAFLRNVPEIARLLAGPASAPRLGGGQAARSPSARAATLNAPGDAAADSAFDRFEEGFERTQGSTLSKFWGGLKGSAEGLGDGPFSQVPEEEAVDPGQSLIDLHKTPKE